MRDTLALEAKELYGSMKNARGTKIGELKPKADAVLRAAKKVLKTTIFNSARSEFCFYCYLFITTRLSPPIYCYPPLLLPVRR